MNRDEIITFARSAITNIFNGKGREPSPLEVETISKWINEMDYSVELIEVAMTIAAKATEYNRMKYADLVLQDFRKKGIRTVAEAEEMFKSAPKKPSYQKSVNSANMTGQQRTVQVPVREDKRIQTPSVKMRPCPFCGYDGIYLVIQNSTKFGTKYVLAECGQCEASTKSIGIHYDVADNVLAETIPEGRQAIDLWNARV